MENGVPPHFHKDYQIEEEDLIPDDRTYPALPDRGLEGERAVVESGSNFSFYRYFKGAWRAISGAGGFTHYPVTVASADVANASGGTTGEQTILSFTIPANTLADGDVIKLHTTVDYKHQMNTSVTMIHRVKIGSSSNTVFNGTAPNNGTTVHSLIVEYTLQRRGTKVYLLTASSSSYTPEGVLFTTPTIDNAAAISSVDFTVNNTLSVTVEYTSGTSGQGTGYWTPGEARAYKLGAVTSSPSSGSSSPSTVQTFPIITKSANYTTTVYDYTILCDATAGAMTISLPAASDMNGRIYNIKKIDSSVNTVTIDPNASETIDGSTTKVLSAQWSSATIHSNGSNWFVL